MGKPIDLLRIRKMRDVLILNKGCVHRTWKDTGLGISTIKRYAKDILDERDKL